MMGRIGAAICVLHVLLLGAAQCSSSTIKIRGLDPSLAEHYKPQGDKFKCLDGDKIIMYSLINDDFCDCFDGSDEPGTTSLLFLAAAWLEGADLGAFLWGISPVPNLINPKVLGCCTYACVYMLMLKSTISTITKCQGPRRYIGLCAWQILLQKQRVQATAAECLHGG